MGLPDTERTNQRAHRPDHRPGRPTGGFDPEFFGRLVPPGGRFLERACCTGFVLAALTREGALRVGGGGLLPDALGYAKQRVPQAELVSFSSGGTLMLPGFGRTGRVPRGLAL
jgi:hypothetical protein